MKKDHLKNLFFLTVLMAITQSLFLSYITSDYAHEFFTIFFFIELLNLIVFYFSYRRKWFWLFLLLSTIIEIVIFIKQDLPISPDEIFMILIVLLRLYIVYKLGKPINWKLK
ncbi:membrane hypothetical protein [Tenacibaculum sp. 190524A02b]|uniref:Uncharacterized protein n=1 Tax=Tenacibaculum vairaonense TaxID=3137860 RepID=A0ABP1FDJ0_9FLAO